VREAAGLGGITNVHHDHEGCVRDYDADQEHEADVHGRASYQLVPRIGAASGSLTAKIGSTTWMMLTMPFVLYAVFRYTYLVEQRAKAARPTRRSSRTSDARHGWALRRDDRRRPLGGQTRLALVGAVKRPATAAGARAVDRAGARRREHEQPDGVARDGRGESGPRITTMARPR